MVLLADVVSIGSRVICQHDASGYSGIILMHLILLGNAFMFVLVELFDCSIECSTQTIGHLVAMLGYPDGQFVVLWMGRINCHILCIVGVALGNDSALVLGMSDAVIEKQVITLAQPLERLLDVLVLGNF